MNVIKNKRDFVLGLVALALSLFLLLSDSVIQGFSMFQTKIYLAQAGAYIEIIAVLMIVVSLAMIIRAFVKKEPGEDQKKSIDGLVVGAFAALIVYLLLMDALGFVINTIWLTALITFMLRVREKQISLKDRKAVLKTAGVSVGYAVILVLVLAFVFTTWLKVRLP